MSQVSRAETRCRSSRTRARSPVHSCEPPRGVQHPIMRRLRIPAVLTVSIVGIVAPFIAGMPACASNGSPRPDAVISDGRGPRGSAGVDADLDASAPTDAGTPTDAAMPADAAPDTPIT